MKAINRTFKTLTAATILLGAQQMANAQGDALTYKAYISNSQTLWQRAVQQHTGNKLSSAMACYGLLNNTMADSDEDTFEEYYDITLELLEELITSGDHVAQSKAVLSSVYGLAIAHDSWKGMYLGPKSGSLIESAYQEDAQDPLVRKLYAASKLYTPQMFGGNTEKALENFKIAIDLYESSGDTVNNWLYLDALAHLGLTYNRMGQTELAIHAFVKALETEPNFGWVKYNLLPAAKESLARQ